ncbi:MAG TPA: adenylate/guanylate cyclase domain-containing protein, partial [Terriglobales bacterium]|nr:adenylate/guanylate cyclase domain-containing protein [Terriglobales bacterium]
MSALAKGTVSFLFTDIEGSTKLANENPELLPGLLSRYHSILRQSVKANEGHVYRIAGDAICAAFQTALNAVKAAVHAQRLLYSESWPGVPVRVRIGIATGTAQPGGTEGFPDEYSGYSAQALANRVMSAAFGGQILVSQATAALVRLELPDDISLREMGPQRFKGFASPEPVWQVVASDLPNQFPQLCTVVGDAHIQPTTIGVLPFVNLSEDPEQAYFCDGLTEDLITELATIGSIHVPARNTMFTYKGKAVNVQQLTNDLGATHVVEGSVRKRGNEIRINVQLIDAKSGNHVWAKRFDCELTNLFQVQDEVVEGIVTELDVRLVNGEQARAWRRSTRNAEAYDLFRQAQFILQHLQTPPNVEHARAMLEKAEALDPRFVAAYVWHAHALCWRPMLGVEDPATAFPAALTIAEKAIGLDDLSGESHMAKGQILFFMKDLTAAERELL